MNKHEKSLCLLVIFASCIWFSTINTMFAGTTQITSPVGLPRSNVQSNFTPSIGDTNPTNFTTPPLPLQGGGIESLAMPAIPLRGTSAQNPALEATVQNIGPAAISPVDSFFQLGLPTSISIPKSSSESVTQTTLKKQKKGPTTKQVKSIPKTVGILFWHVLDNFGIPLPVSKNNDLDPSLSHTDMTLLLEKPSQGTVNMTPQKIPESELEGTEVSPNNDK